MTSFRRIALAALALGAGSCSDQNASRLWLTLIGPESAGVMGLVEAEPNPY